MSGSLATTGQPGTLGPQQLAEVVRAIAATGDFSRLTDEQRGDVVLTVCRSLGLNPIAKPFEFLRLNGKMVLYATRGATDQLAAIHRINRKIVRGPEVTTILKKEVVIAVCEATHPNGRVEQSTATCDAADACGVTNVLMKVETKAKRRATLAILGLAVLDEMEAADTGLARADAPTPAPQVIDAPEGSRAFATFVHAIEVTEGMASAAEVHVLYHDLVAGLHEEGADAEHYLSGHDGAEARVWRACTLPLTEAERRAILADTTRSLAAKVDAAAEAGGDGLDEAARWWIAYRASFTATEAPVVWSLLARVAAGLDAPDAAATGKAKKALKAAVEALTPPTPPTGTDAPSAAQHEASVGDAAATSTTEAPRAWAPVTTSDGVTIDTEDSARARIATMTPHALRGSFRRHREHAAWCALIVEHWARRFSTAIDNARRELVAAADLADTAKNIKTAA